MAFRILVDYKILGFLLILNLISTPIRSQTLKVSSKNFNESYILGEIIVQILEDRGYQVERQFGLGGTMICYQALINGEIDMYPEYSGTIEKAIFKLQQPTSFEQLQNLLKSEYSLELLNSFGFNNTYAITVKEELAKKLKLKSISDLRHHPELRVGLSYEFLERTDGWGELAKAYSLPIRPIGMEHGLSYQALNQNEIQVMDVYSTDAEIQKYDLVLLEDDLNFFPKYLAAPLVRSELSPDIKQILSELSGRINDSEMQRLNAEVAIDKKSFAETAHTFLLKEGLLQNQDSIRLDDKWLTLGSRTLTHIKLTAIALLAAMVMAVPFGILIYRLPVVSRPIIYFAGLLQTIPSIALLALMIPLFGIGAKPAVVALFLYALLPILRSTFAALNSIDPILKKVSVGMGLTVWQRLRYIEIPLATPNMLAGIRTATVINIGTATLAAFIGAGGLGEPIVTGLSLNDPYLIMWGAIPAAVLAIIIELLFEALERLVIPKHLLQKQAR